LGLDTALAGYEKVLSKQTYLAGSELTAADLFHLPYMKITKDAGFASAYEKYPNVKRWCESLENLESWRKVCAIAAASMN
jgi:glutathione S-transferase